MIVLVLCEAPYRVDFCLTLPSRISRIAPFAADVCVDQLLTNCARIDLVGRPGMPGNFRGQRRTL
jgi:hypothetical protein